MQRYTVCSRGIPIGITELSFARVDRRNPWGAFEPNEEGERVMAVVRAVLPALKASAGRHVRGGDAPPAPQVGADDPALPSALSDALERVERLDLTLHRADGTLIPTESVYLRDVEQLLTIFSEQNARAEAEAEAWYQGLGEEEREKFDREIQEMIDGAACNNREPWTAEEEPAEPERYHVHVRLVDEWDVP